MSEFKAQYGFDLSYYSNLYYGSVDYVYKLAYDNNIGVDDDITGMTLVYDESFIESNPPELSNNLVITPEQNEYQSFSNQNIFDLSLQLYGSLDYAYKVVQGSTMKGINDKVSRNIKFDPTTFKDGILKANIAKNGINYATGAINEAVRVLATENRNKAITTADGKLILII